MTNNKGFRSHSRTAPTEPFGIAPTGSILILAVVFCLTGRLALELAIPPGHASAVWPPAGIALAALLVWGYRVWPGVLIGAIAITIWGSDPANVSWIDFALATSIAISATLQALAAAFLVRRYAGFPCDLSSGKTILVLIVLGGMVGGLIGATLGAGCLLAFGLIEPQEYLFSAWNWWIGDTIGVLVFTPLLLIWSGSVAGAWRSTRRLVTLFLLVGLVIVLAAFHFAYSRDQASVDEQFQETARGLEAALKTRITITQDVLASLQSFYKSRNNVTADEFRVYTARALEKNPAISALSWNEYIYREYRSVAEAGVDEGIAGQAADRQMRPAAAAQEYVVVRYIEPVEPHQRAVGYDVNSDPDRRAALAIARDTGEPTSTRRLHFAQSDQQESGMLVFGPVYDGATLPATVSERRAALRGYVASELTVEAILDETFAGFAFNNLALRVFDASAISAGPMVGYGETKIHQAAVFNYQRSLPFFDRELVLEISAGNDYLTAKRWPGLWVVLVGGLTLLGLLEALLFVITAHAQREAERAAEMERVNKSLAEQVELCGIFEQVLFEEKERAEITLHSIADGVITTDPEGSILYLNPVAETLTGWQLVEAAGRSLSDVYRLYRKETTGRESVDPRTIGTGEHSTGLLDADLQLESRDGKQFSIRHTVREIVDHSGTRTGLVIAFQDVSEARAMAQDMVHRAMHDSLTGLINRGEFERRLGGALMRCRERGAEHVLCYLDLDQFKLVNDTSGHMAGDELLCRITTLLQNKIRSRDTVARLGGDEFGVLLENCPLEQAEVLAEEMVREIRNSRFTWEGRVFQVGVSIGVVALTQESADVSEVLSRADLACYTAKDLGRNRIHVFHAGDSVSLTRHNELKKVADLRSAMEEGRLHVYAQPIISLSAGTANPAHYELLLRLVDEDHGMVLPGGFIQAAERFGLMAEIDRWMINEALTRYPKNLDEPITIGINLSGNSLDEESLSDFVEAAISESSVPPSSVCFEITETAAVSKLEAAVDFIERISALGCRFALDDFGSGISSFRYLKNLPVDFLKIDGSLVREIANDASVRAMVTAIHNIGRAMGIQTIAEYASDAETLKVLRDIGVDYAQGNLLGAPEPLEQIGMHHVPPEIAAS